VWRSFNTPGFGENGFGTAGVQVEVAQDMWFGQQIMDNNNIVFNEGGNLTACEVVNDGNWVYASPLNSVV
jgi:hypothetical protein